LVEVIHVIATLLNLIAPYAIAYKSVAATNKLNFTMSWCLCRKATSCRRRAGAAGREGCFLDEVGVVALSFKERGLIGK